MDSRLGGTPAASANHNRDYEDFEPPLEWVKDESADTLVVFLPGFQKDKLKIQITSGHKLRVTGQRSMGQNKWRRFQKEFPLASDCDTNKISATFEGGILYVRIPKPIPSKTSPIPTPAKPTDHQPQPPEKVAPKPKPKPKPTPVDQSQQKAAAVPQLPPLIPAPAPPQKHQTKDAADEIKKEARKVPEEEKKDAQKVPEKTPAAMTNEKKKQELARPLQAVEKAEKKKALDDAKSPEKASAKPSKSSGGFYNYMKVMKGLPEGVNKISPRTLVNSVLAVLFVGVLALYVKSFFKRSFGEDESSPEL